VNRFNRFLTQHPITAEAFS